MPPKVRITKESIVATAVDLVRRDGAGAINARTIAKELNCSTQPVFSNFATMEELRLAVVDAADTLYREYTEQEVASGKYPVYKATGMAYIRFAKEEKELRFKIMQADFRPVGEKVIAELAAWASALPFATPATDNREGFRVSFDKDHGDGWLLLRLSVHDPILPLNIESNTDGGCKQIAELLYDFIKQYEDIDIQPLKDYIK